MREDRRRRFLLASSALLAAPLASFAQPAQKVRRIGVLLPGAADSGDGEFHRRELIAALRHHGYRDGTNLNIEWRWADGYPERLDALAKNLVRADVELIVTIGGSLSTEAAMRVTRSIPIVMHAATTPVESGLIQSLAKPGGNVTGTSWAGVEIVEKLFQVLKEAMPAGVRVAVMRNPSTLDARIYMDAYERAARDLGLSIQYFFVTRPDEVDAALTQIDTARPDALLVAHNPVIAPRYPAILAFARARKMLTAGTTVQIVDEGAILTYQPDRGAIYERTASYVDRILRGAKPGALPVELPTNYELVVNAKAAHAIGYKIPQSLLLRADRVIE